MGRQSTRRATATMFLNEDAFNVDDDGAGGRRGDGMRCATPPRPLIFLFLRDPRPGGTTALSRDEGTPGGDARAGRTIRPASVPSHRASFPSVPRGRFDARGARPDRRSTRSTRRISPGVPRRFSATAPDTTTRDPPTDPPSPPPPPLPPSQVQPGGRRAKRRAPRAPHAPPDVHAPSGARPRRHPRDPAPPRARRAAQRLRRRPATPRPPSVPSTGIGTSRHESAATFHNDLFAGEPAAGATSGRRERAAAAAKAAKARHSPRRNAASDRCTAEPSCRMTRWASRPVRSPPPPVPVAPSRPAVSLDLDRPRRRRLDKCTPARARRRPRRRAPSPTRTRASNLAAIRFPSGARTTVRIPRSAPRTAASRASMPSLDRPGRAARPRAGS